MKTTKMMKKTMRTQNILIINHLLDVTDWKYFKSSPWAASTFSSVASTLASILNTKKLQWYISRLSNTLLTKLAIACPNNCDNGFALVNGPVTCPERAFPSCPFSRPCHWLPIFPRLALTTCFPALGTDSLYILPRLPLVAYFWRLPLVAYFAALAIGCLFFPHFALVACFPTLGIDSFFFLHPWHRLHVFVSTFDWLIALFPSVVSGRK